METTNIQILEAILNRNLQTEQEEEINNLKKLNSYCSKDPDQVFLLDTDETPNLIGYVSPEDLNREDIKETLWESEKILDFLGIVIYKVS